MSRAIRRLLERLGLCVIIEWSEEPGAPTTEYMTRFYLSPRTRWGRLYLHCFHRGDLDRDPHDHPFDFWTLPLNQGYTEQVYDHGKECFNYIDVPQAHWGFRQAYHTHRVTATESGRWPLWTLVWRGPTRRPWGYWVFMSKHDTRRSFVSDAAYFMRRTSFGPSRFDPCG